MTSLMANRVEDAISGIIGIPIEKEETLIGQCLAQQ